MPDSQMVIPEQLLKLGQRVKVVGEYENDWRGTQHVVVGAVFVPNLNALQYATVEVDEAGQRVSGLTDGWRPDQLETSP